jgi:hypothetical protein
MEILERELLLLGQSPQNWEIFRGDSFQAEINDPMLALEYSIRIKAAIKTIKEIDVRIAIGIGDKTYTVPKITQCNGTAFVNSGHKFETIERDRINLAIQTPWADFDREMNLYFRLALIGMDNWTANGAAIVNLALKNRDKSQEELGKIVGIKQNSVSTRLKRAFYAEILALIDMYKEKLATKL